MAIPHPQPPMMYDPAKTHSGKSGFIGSLPAQNWANIATNGIGQLGDLQAARGNEVEEMSDQMKEERAIEHELKMKEIKRVAARKEKAEEAFCELERYWYKFLQLALCLAGLAGVFAGLRVVGMIWAML